MVLKYTIPLYQAAGKFQDAVVIVLAVQKEASATANPLLFKPP
jgi:hypothetical protein